MDFFAQQDKARHNTRRLVVYFIAGVAGIIVTIYLAVALVFSGVHHRMNRGQRDPNVYSIAQPSLWHPDLFAGVALGTLAVIGIGSLFKTIELSAGGSAVSTMMGGRLVNSGTTNPDERKLLNVVEEMAIAAGVPVPQVYVLDDEHGINAFAAGHTISDATVTVTQGCMKILTRDELQGVIGHEFSHILNGDMRLNLRLMGIIFGLLCLAVIGRILLQVRGSSRGKQNPLPVVGLILIFFGWIGVFFGRLIQAAVSRQREFLADASAVQFTRNPSGLAGALKKIGGLGEMGSRLSAPHAAEVSHMFFSNGMAPPFFGLLATHPPLVDRIKALDPTFDGKFELTHYQPDLEEAPLATKRPVAKEKRDPIPFGMRTVIAAQTVLPQVGAPTPVHLQYAEQLRSSFPPNLETAARDPLGASALIYGLLLSPDETERGKQLQLLAQQASAGIQQETTRLLPDVTGVAQRARLPLVDLALPALRQLSAKQYEEFSKLTTALIESDNEIDLFEYVLQKIVLRHLEPQFKGARKPVIQYYAIKALADDCAVLLSAMANAGTTDRAKAEAAFQRGAGRLSYQTQTPLAFLPEDQSDLPQVDAALNRLNLAVPQIKKNVLDACAQTVAADGMIEEMEAELLRAIADTLDCPMPPLVDQPKESAKSPAT